MYILKPLKTHAMHAGHAEKGGRLKYLKSDNNTQYTVFGKIQSIAVYHLNAVKYIPNFHFHSPRLMKDFESC